MEAAVEPILRHVRRHEDDDELDDPRQRGDGGAERLPIARMVVDDRRGREREEAEYLHEHRADEIIEKILAPFGAKQALRPAMREGAFQGREHEAGDEQVDDEKVEPDEATPVARKSEESRVGKEG